MSSNLDDLKDLPCAELSLEQRLIDKMKQVKKEREELDFHKDNGDIHNNEERKTVFEKPQFERESRFKGVTLRES
jgi:hypothetical protein